MMGRGGQRVGTGLVDTAMADLDTVRRTPPGDRRPVYGTGTDALGARRASLPISR